jgi:ABC-type nitrate/sulfonate/bicarbonate transport system permease component
VNNEFIDAAVSLGAGDKFIFDKVRWKIIEPAVAESLKDIHFHLWSILIVFEFIKGGSGLGAILRTTLLFKDLAGLLVYVVIISLLILVGASIINYFKNKIFFWSIN